jgi:hypothetical protein
MPVIDFPHSFLEGLSDFWQRFFNEADQLDAMYQGSAILMGQAYLDLLSNVLGVSLKDAPVFHKEYFKLVTLREDQLHYERGAASDDDRWVYAITDDLVAFASLDNRVLEPTASLEERRDYDLAPGQIRFKVDPTDPAGTGVPLPGFARRGLDVATGGAFDDTTRAAATSWASLGVRKGDTLRLLDVGPDPLHPQQRKRSDHAIALVRPAALFVAGTTPLVAATAPKSYVVLRHPARPEVTFEPLAFSDSDGRTTANLGHTHVDQGSVRVFARAPSGADVVEGIDYVVDYERGALHRLTVWQESSAPTIQYTWMEEVWPPDGAVPRASTTGVVRSGPTTTRVVQMALWAPDAFVDRRVLARNFGSLIGVERDSSESYRTFLRGIFQLYVLGPVLERIESALNVVLGLPVVRDDGEVLAGVDTTEPLVNRVTTQRPATRQLATYEFPKETPLRADLTTAQVGKVTFQAFEPLTTAVTVTDYVQDPSWWHSTVIPPELLAEGGAAAASRVRRTSSPFYVKHVVGANDQPRFGDPGLKVGADEHGLRPAPGHPIFRHRLAFVLMDQFLKFHTFFVRFDPTVFAQAGARFARSFSDLETLVLTAKPSHTFAIVQPATTFLDRVQIPEAGVYQPQRYHGADHDAAEVYASIDGLPDPGQPSALLGLGLQVGVGTPTGQRDEVLFTDGPLVFGANGWRFGDHSHYEPVTAILDFPAVGATVTLPSAPPGPRRRRVVRVYVATAVGGRRLVENVDYSVDPKNATLRRLTGWDQTRAVPVSVLQLHVGNLADGPPDHAQGDTALLVAATDPAHRTARFPDAIDWLGQPISASNPRDLGLVERVLTIKVLPAG